MARWRPPASPSRSPGRGRAGPAALAALACLLGLCLAAAPALPHALSGPGLILPDLPDNGQPELTLLTVRLNESLLGDALPCFTTQTGTLVPFGAVCALLDLGIRVDTSRAVAEGFFLSERRHFLLDARAGRVRVEGREIALDSTAARMLSGDLYVDAARVSEWLPLDLTVDPLGATLRIHPREPLPMQLRLQRLALIARNLGGLAGGPSYARADSPYRLASLPFVDQTLSFTSVPRGAGDRLSSLRHSTWITGDLLFTQASVFVAGETAGGPSELRVRMGRRDPEAGLLGPLAAREVAAGDVAYPGLDLVSRPATGDGVVVSSAPLQQPTQFDAHTFVGEIMPGWDVELYRNGALLGYQQAGPDGRYVFENIPLLFGPNVFEKVFYGPLGQRRVETEVYDVTNDLVAPGRTYYQAVASDVGGAHERALLGVSRGLTGALSGSAAVTSVHYAGATRRYGKLGARVFLGRLLGSLDFAAQEGAGRALRGSLQARIQGVGVLLRQTSLLGFRSEALDDPAHERRITQLRLDASPKAPLLPRLPMTLDLTRDVSDRFRELRQLSARVAFATHGLWVSSMHTWTQQRTAGQATATQGYGVLLWNRQVRRVALRGELDYDVAPERRVTSLQLTTEVPVGEAAQVALGVVRYPQAGGERYSVSFNQGEGPVGFGMQGSYSPRTGTAATFSVTLGLDREPRSGRWYSHAHGVAGAGAASARVFLDLDGNGRWDAGEPAIGGARLTVNNAPGGELTDTSGVSFVDRIAETQDVSLGVEPATLEDPMWVLESPGARVTPRAGHVAEVDFPVRITGEITGTIRRRAGSVSPPAEGMDLELVDAATGEVAGRTRTDYDGFYDFAGLAPGHYTVRFAGDQLAQLGLSPENSRHFDILPSGTVLESQDFALVPAGREPNLAVTAPGAETPEPDLAAITPGEEAAAEPAPPEGSPARAAALPADLPAEEPSLQPAFPGPVRLPAGPPTPMPGLRPRTPAATPLPARSLASLGDWPTGPGGRRYQGPPTPAPSGPRPAWTEPFRVLWDALVRSLGLRHESSPPRAPQRHAPARPAPAGR